jgi:hypothetical protein
MIALFLLAACVAGAQSTLTLTQTAASPKVDGIVNAKEYALTSGNPELQLSLSWTADTLWVALSGQTTGWVAVGVGSTAMDGAVMYIGYVSGDKTQIKVQQGAGHRHGDINSNAPVQYAMKEAGGRTTVEVALKAAEFIAKDQKQLDLVVAMGAADSFISMHKVRAGISVNLAR